MKREYFVGDDCWVRLRGLSGTHRGKVMAYFTLDTQPAEYYIIQLDSRDYPYLEIRDATLMADKANTALPIDGAHIVTTPAPRHDLDA